jgi:hydrogenase maturation protein HypF
MAVAERLALRLRVRGRVQGVGFRPAVYRLADRLGLAGWVCNDGDGVLIHLEGDAETQHRFQLALPGSLPTGARVESIRGEAAEDDGRDHFEIIMARRDPQPTRTRVPSDRATCEACRREVFQFGDRRKGYPFTTCTDCGPRYSILEHLPYERCHTSMRHFSLCRDCRDEYEQASQRRFHAEPIACPACGPRVEFRHSAFAPEWDESALEAAANCLRAGQILALQGLGGFQLLVRADDATAVGRLRARKCRPSKPLAVMVPSVDQLTPWARISTVERMLLESPENPIVIVAVRPDAAPLAAAIAPHLRHVGILLPTTPLHHLLLAMVGLPVVATSGNRSDEPIATNEVEASQLTDIADAYLLHDRPIHRRVDDSVLRVVDGESLALRLARGYAPWPLPRLEEWAQRRGLEGSSPVLAVGGQQKSTLALWNGYQAVLAPHVGDLDSIETRHAFAELARDFPRLYGPDPAVIACDMHPDYFTTRWAHESGRACITVQHHHAHAVACMAEHGLLHEEVLALTWDGTGYGPDGTVWGGEILRARCDGYRRIGSLRLMPLPGGDLAIREPARVAFGVLAEAFGPDAIPGALLDRIALTKSRAGLLLQMIRRGVNTPQTSSVGRLFDAVAALLLGTVRVSYEGEAAARLEASVDPGTEDAYVLPIERDAAGLGRADWRPLVRALAADIAAGVDAGIGAARFHNALAAWASAAVRQEAETKIVLAGGCFQNAWLLRRVRAALEEVGRRVFVPRLVPPGDGGLAVGQLAIALAVRR